MAIRALGPNQLEFTADGDVLLDTIWVGSFTAITTSGSGDVTVETNILDGTGALDTAGTFNGGPGVVWRSPGMNANETIESAPMNALMRGLRVALAPDTRLVANLL